MSLTPRLESGPTGAHGWVYGWAGNISDARQIPVTAVANGSPVDGVLYNGDVILGADGKPFSGDARIQFTNTITAAELEKGGGLPANGLYLQACLQAVRVLSVATSGIFIHCGPTKMPSSNQDDTLLLIRCPSCAQRFKVGEDLRNRTVECGGCEHRFKIKDDVILRGKKFFPGEREETVLSRFSRIERRALSPLEVAHYQARPVAESFEPASPQRIIAGVAGGTGMVLMALILILGASHGGILDGMITQDRILMAGFAGLLGIVLLLYANPKARIKALGFGLLMAAILISLPFVFKVGSVPMNRDAKVNFSAFEKKPSEITPSDTPDSKLKEQIGTQPLENSIALLEASGSSKIALGLWLKDLRLQKRFLIRDYIQRVTGASDVPHFYPRDHGNFLLVVTGSNHTLEEVAKLASVLGTVENIHTSLSVIEVKVNNGNFVSGSAEKLSDMTNPAFYDLNLKELDSIDLNQVAEAVRRLSQAEPKVYRSDITRKLIALLGASWITFKGDICGALAVWSEKPGPAGEMALAEARILLEKKLDVPKDMIALIVKEENRDVIPILNQLWREKPTEWEKLYEDMGPAAEASLIASFPATEAGLRQSAVRLLGQIGGKDSLPVLKSAMGVGNPEMKVLTEKALEAIEDRIGR